MTGLRFKTYLTPLSGRKSVWTLLDAPRPAHVINGLEYIVGGHRTDDKLATEQEESECGDALLSERVLRARV